MAHALEHYCYVTALIILIFLSLVFYLDWKFNRLYLTNYRLIRESGIIGKRYMSVRLSNIEDTTCTFGILGRILGYGDLIIESAGTYGQMIFKGIPKPRKMKTLIERWRFYSDVRR
ncbi:MAG: PH domain-containing protein [Candidatus Aminicenantales bacterium]